MLCVELWFEEKEIYKQVAKSMDSLERSTTRYRFPKSELHLRIFIHFYSNFVANTYFQMCG